MDDVRAHAQAHMTGYLDPLVLSGAGGDRPATTGATMACQVYSASRPDNTAWQLYLVVLDDTGGYLIVPDTSWHSDGACPGLADYAPGGGCVELTPVTDALVKMPTRTPADWPRGPASSTPDQL